MVKFFESSDRHFYPFPTVTLAYFLRYPNPLSTHVLSTDVISRHYDPTTKRLYTARLHLKRSKIPGPVLNLIPSSLLNGGSSNPHGTSQAYILERSVVDMKDGVMVTESKNLEFTRVLSVVERQAYRRPGVDLANWCRTFKAPISWCQDLLPSGGYAARGAGDEEDGTIVTTKVELYSRLGQARGSRLRKAWGRNDSDTGGPGVGEEDGEPPAKMGFWRSLSTSSIQRSVEAIGLRRTQRAVPKSREGLNVVLERLRHGGLVAVLEGMRQDRDLAFGGGGGPSFRSRRDEVPKHSVDVSYTPEDD